MAGALVTLKDIASNLDLSVMAVSKALRDSSDISTNTKARVQAEARRLGYVPNRSARSLRAGSSLLIGCIMPSFEDNDCIQIFKGLEAEASELDFDMLVASSMNQAEREILAFRRMVQHKIDAVFIYSAAQGGHRSLILDEAARLQVPTLFVGQYPADLIASEKAGWVAADNLRAGYIATEYLISQGHKKILYLAGPLGSSRAAEHFSGYKKALMDQEVEMDETLVFLAGTDWRSGQATMAQVMDEAVDFTAVVCLSDSVALGAMSYLRKQGVRLPDEVSFVGYGDEPESEFLAVPLTTIRVLRQEIGQCAFRLWLQRKNTNQSFGQRILPVELVIRKSVMSLQQETSPTAIAQRS
ncbi:MAG: LacI family DNA-binding transcriptional regulator [Verrucomicrobiota bacterium]